MKRVCDCICITPWRKIQKPPSTNSPVKLPLPAESSSSVLLPKSLRGKGPFFLFFFLPFFLFYQSADSSLSLTLNWECFLRIEPDLDVMMIQASFGVTVVFGYVLFVVVVAVVGVVVFCLLVCFLVLFLKNGRAQENSKLAKIVKTETKLFVKTKVTIFRRVVSTAFSGSRYR